MLFIKKMVEKLNLFYFSVLTAILIPTTSFAQSATDTGPDLMVNFRHQLLSSLSGAFLGNNLINFSDNGIMKALLGICTIVAIFQVVHDSYGSDKFLVEWVKIPIYAIFAMNITGQSTLMRNMIPPSQSQLNYPGVSKTLDMDVYFMLEDIFDEIAKEIDATYGTNGPQGYMPEYKKLMINMKGFSNAINNCKNPTASTACFAEQFQKIKSQQEGTSSSGVNSKDPNAIKSAPGIADQLRASLDPTPSFIAKLTDFFDTLFSPAFPLLIVQGAMVVLEYVRLFINYFTLIAFSLMTAMSLFFCKLLAPFIVLPKQRSKVMAAFKMPLSATMYGFISSLVIALAALIIKGVNAAILSTLLAKTATGGSVSSTDLFQIVLAATLCISAILGLQIAAMKQIPGLCRKLWDLSLTEIVEFGKTVVEAGMGALKTAAMVAAGGAMAVGAGVAAGVGGAVGAAGSAAGSAAAGGAGTLGKIGAGIKGGVGGGLKSGLNKFGSQAVRMAQGGKPGGLKSLFADPEQDSPIESTNAGKKSGNGGGGDGGGNGGGGKTGAPMGFKDAKQALGKADLGGNDGKGSAWSGVKKIGGSVLDVAEAGVKTVGGLAMDAISVGQGKETDVLGNLGKNSANIMEQGSGVAKSFQEHSIDRKQAAQVQQAKIASSREMLALGGGDKNGGEAINKDQLGSLLQKQEKGKEFSADDHSTIFKMVTDGDIGSLKDSEQDSLKKLSSSPEFQKYTANNVKSMTSVIDSGSASESDHLNFSKFKNSNKEQRLKEFGSIVKGGSVDKKIISAENHSSHKSFESNRKQMVSNATKDLILSHNDSTSNDVNYSKAENLKKLVDNGYVMSNDWRSGDLNEAEEISQRDSLYHIEETLKKLDKNLKYAEKKQDIDKIFEIKKEIERLNQGKSQYKS